MENFIFCAWEQDDFYPAFMEKISRDNFWRHSFNFQEWQWRLQPSQKFADNYIKCRPYFFSLQWPASNSRWSLYNENNTILLSLFKGMKYFELKYKDKIKMITP